MTDVVIHILTPHRDRTGQQIPITDPQTAVFTTVSVYLLELY